VASLIIRVVIELGGKVRTRLRPVAGKPSFWIPVAIRQNLRSVEMHHSAGMRLAHIRSVDRRIEGAGETRRTGDATRRTCVGRHEGRNREWATVAAKVTEVLWHGPAMGSDAGGRNASVGVNKLANPDEAIADAVIAAMIEFARRLGHPPPSACRARRGRLR
jgi:hypothetical protein